MSDLGTVNQSAIYLDSVDSSNPFDIYNFTRPELGALSLTLEGLSGRVDVQLREANQRILYSASAIPEAPANLDLETLPGGDYSLQILSPTGVTQSQYQLTLTVNDELDPITGLGIESGFFVVDPSGEIGVDFIYDGSVATGELGIFSLRGMENFELGSSEFIQEAARRALSNSPLGYVVISDGLEGAKLSGELGETANWNQGEYLETKTFSMEPGDLFALLLVPNNTVQTVFDHPIPLSLTASSGNRALFSLISRSPDSPLHRPQMTSLTADGTAIVIEEQPVGVGFNRDHNDLIVKLTGVTGRVISFDEVIAADQDWRNTELGQEILAAVTPAPILTPSQSSPESRFPMVAPVILGAGVPELEEFTVPLPTTVPEKSDSETANAKTSETASVSSEVKADQSDVAVLSEEQIIRTLSIPGEENNSDETVLNENVLIDSLTGRTASQIDLVTTATITESQSLNAAPIESRWKGSEIPFDPKMLIDPNTLTPFDLPITPSEPATADPLLNPQPSLTPLSPATVPAPELTPREDDRQVPGEPLPLVEPESSSEESVNPEVEIIRRRNSTIDSEEFLMPQPTSPLTPAPVLPSPSTSPAILTPLPSINLQKPVNPNKEVPVEQPQGLDSQLPTETLPTTEQQPLLKTWENQVTNLALLFSKVWWTQITNLQNLFFARSWHLPGSQTPGLDIPQVAGSEVDLLDLGTIALDPDLEKQQ